MAKFVSHIRISALALGVSLGLAASVGAAPLSQVQPEAPPAGAAAIQVQADCYAIGQRVAAERGGTLAKASAATRGGKAVCVIVIVVPGKDGQRGQRQEIEVPAG